MPGDRPLSEDPALLLHAPDFVFTLARVATMLPASASAALQSFCGFRARAETPVQPTPALVPHRGGLAGCTPAGPGAASRGGRPVSWSVPVTQLSPPGVRRILHMRARLVPPLCGSSSEFNVPTSVGTARGRHS
jgi:hypothetical protein